MYLELLEGVPVKKNTLYVTFLRYPCVTLREVSKSSQKYQQQQKVPSRDTHAGLWGDDLDEDGDDGSVVAEVPHYPEDVHRFIFFDSLNKH